MWPCITRQSYFRVWFPIVCLNECSIQNFSGREAGCLQTSRLCSYLVLQITYIICMDCTHQSCIGVDRMKTCSYNIDINSFVKRKGCNVHYVCRIHYQQYSDNNIQHTLQHCTYVTIDALGSVLCLPPIVSHSFLRKVFSYVPFKKLIAGQLSRIMMSGRVTLTLRSRFSIRNKGQR